MNNAVNELYTDKNETVYSNSDILGEMCNFYERLYSSKFVPDDEIDNYLSSLNLDSVLSDRDKELCDTFP